MDNALGLTVPHLEHNSIRRRALRAVPWLWLALSALWASVIYLTDQAAWALAIWIATTLGPITMLQARLKTQRVAP